MSCDIIIPVYNQLGYTKGCIESIQKHTDYKHRIIVIDDSSGEEAAVYLDRLSSINEIILLRNQSNLGWVKSVNKGIAYSKAEYACVMNNDTLVYPGWLSEMVNIAEKENEIGIVNPIWELPKNYCAAKGDYFKNVIRKQQGKFMETDWARGFCFLVKRKVLEKIGGLDEIFSPGYYDDWDFSLRAVNAGFTVVRAQGAFVWHYRNITYEQKFGRKGMDAEFNAKKQIFLSRWGKFKKALLVVDGSLKDKENNIKKACLYLLRQQARLVVFKGGNKFSVNHTNCFVKETSDYFLKAAVLLHLLRNSLRSANRRYDYVICSEHIKNFLDKFKFISGKFVLKRIAELPSRGG